MSASDPELKDGRSLPSWMKTKTTKMSCDCDYMLPAEEGWEVHYDNCPTKWKTDETFREFEPFAASPPSEDSFLFIKYPRAEVFKQEPSDGLRGGAFEGGAGGIRSGNYDARERDWSRHTKPCQDVLHGIAPINTAVNSATSKPKPAGTDDGFKGEGAACGTSVLKVATQMISSGRSSRGFTVAAPDEDAVDAHMRQQYHAARRGSRSLPVSPAHTPPGSPGGRRRNVNRYFTSPFEPSSETAGARSWLTAALLGFKKELATSTSTLAEEDMLEPRLQAMSFAESVESLGPAPRPPRPPRPNELREMNFWSPTSM